MNLQYLELISNLRKILRIFNLNPDIIGETLNDLGTGNMEDTRSLNNQEMRSARMQTKIMIATLDCIYEIGLHKTSTIKVSKKAGVSRGALLHHFPNKEVLISSAVTYLLETEITDIRKVADAYAHKEMTIDDFIDNLWNRFSGRLFMITMDFLSVARTDDKLRDAISPTSLKFHASLNEIWTQFFTPLGVDEEQVKVLLNATISLLRGMGVQTIIRDDKEYYDGMISVWKLTLHGILNKNAHE